MAVDFNTRLAQPTAELQQASSKARSLEADVPTLADKLRDALTSRLENPMMEQRNEAIQNFLQAGEKARTERSAEGLLSPSQIDTLVSQQRRTAMLPVMNLTSLIGAKMGGIDDVISQGTNAFQSLVAAAQGRESLAQQNYNLALQALTRQAEEEERQRQERQQQFANLLGIKEITGGEITLPSGETFTLPSEAARAAAKREPAKAKKPLDEELIRQEVNFLLDIAQQENALEEGEELSYSFKEALNDIPSSIKEEVRKRVFQQKGRQAALQQIAPPKEGLLSRLISGISKRF